MNVTTYSCKKLQNRANSLNKRKGPKEKIFFIIVPPREDCIFPYILLVLDKNIFVLNKNILLENFHSKRHDFYKGELLRNQLPLCRQPILLWGKEMAHILKTGHHCYSIRIGIKPPSARKTSDRESKS